MYTKPLLHSLYRVNLNTLCMQARAVCRHYYGTEVFIRGLIEFSNYCVRDCHYCGLRRSNRTLHRYRINQEEIVACARAAYTQGLRTIVLQSGDDPAYTGAMLAALVRRIKKQCPGCALTLSIGERPFGDYAALRQAGVDRYLLKHETANPRRYQALHPGQSFLHRIRILYTLRRLGYQVGTGFIIGLPQQTEDDLVEDLLLIQKLRPAMVGIGPFLPAAHTPLAAEKPGTLALVLRMLALIRITIPWVLLPATTALSTRAAADGLEKGLRAGCNVIMCDMTPARYRTLYTIYDHKQRITLTRARAAIHRAGLKLSFARGDIWRPLP